MVVQSIFQNIDSVSGVAGNRGQEALSLFREGGFFCGGLQCLMLLGSY